MEIHNLFGNGIQVEIKVNTDRTEVFSHMLINEEIVLLCLKKNILNCVSCKDACCETPMLDQECKLCIGSFDRSGVAACTDLSERFVFKWAGNTE